jgi:hypothetical protein
MWSVFSCKLHVTCLADQHLLHDNCLLTQATPALPLLFAQDRSLSTPAVTGCCSWPAGFTSWRHNSVCCPPIGKLSCPQQQPQQQQQGAASALRGSLSVAFGPRYAAQARTKGQVEQSIVAVAVASPLKEG